MAARKTQKQLEALLKQHGLTMETTKGGHIAILKDGKKVSTASHSGSWNSHKALVRHLVRDGFLPTEAKRVKFS